MRKAILSAMISIVGVAVAVTTAIAAYFFNPRGLLFCDGLSSQFLGNRIQQQQLISSSSFSSRAIITMRKQKASDRRTRRMQRGGDGNGSGVAVEVATTATTTLTSSPMTKKGKWKLKKLDQQVKLGIIGTDKISSSRINSISIDNNNKREGGRGRSRKRSALYRSISLYHTKFFNFLTKEYQSEEEEVTERIKSSVEDPIGLELAGHALFDMYPERRGNLFSDEIYRLVKAHDATTTTASAAPPPAKIRNADNDDGGGGGRQRQQKQLQLLPSNNKFSKNDIILLTLQPMGSGDYFDPKHLPTSSSSGVKKVEGRVINRGPTYIDVAINAGMFEATFFDDHDSSSNSNSNISSGRRGSTTLRLRADRFFSNIPYLRMMDAITKISLIPENNNSNQQQQQKQEESAANKSKKKKTKSSSFDAGNNSNNKNIPSSSSASPPHSNICMDDVFRELIISSHDAFVATTVTGTTTDPQAATAAASVEYDDYLVSLEKHLSKPPMPSSSFLANQVLNHILIQQSQSKSQQFNSNNNSNNNNAFLRNKRMNGSQLAAIRAALTRKLTLIQGPPGTGKTTTASMIGFGFVHQCRSISSTSSSGSASSNSAAKVLASAFSNAGADNLAEAFLNLGLKVVRIGKPSAMSESLWMHSLDYAIDRDPDAQSAQQYAAKATASLMKIRNKKGSSSVTEQRAATAMATMAVKRSIEASNIAATKALREADIIVSTCTGAADPRLLTACGLNSENSNNVDGSNSSNNKRKSSSSSMMTEQRRTIAPDGLPPLSLPFVIIDEACQSVEPGTLIPLTASNSCRSLVLLGDPCQLPPTVKNGEKESGVDSNPSLSSSSYSISLMERLAVTLPAPSGVKMWNHNKNSAAADNQDEKFDAEFTDSLPIKQARSFLLMRRRSSSKWQQEKQQKTYRKRFAGCLLLNVQYRMHPSIAAFSSAMFYDGLLVSPAYLTHQRRFPSIWNKMNKSENIYDINNNQSNNVNVKLINVGGRCNEMKGESNNNDDNNNEHNNDNNTAVDAASFGRRGKRKPVVYYNSNVFPRLQDSSTTYRNEAEAVRVVSLIKQILEDDINSNSEYDNNNNNNNGGKRIGVITPYNGQVHLIKSLLSNDPDLISLVRATSTTIEVNSVDGYQGRERDVIIFSCVRSNRFGKIGFLSDWRRLNVALTRAKSALLVVCDAETLTESYDIYWGAFIKWCEGTRCIVDDTEDPYDCPLI